MIVNKHSGMAINQFKKSEKRTIKKCMFFKHQKATQLFCMSHKHTNSRRAGDAYVDFGLRSWPALYNFAGGKSI